MKTGSVDYFTSWRELIDARLASLMGRCSAVRPQTGLQEAGAYVIQGGGKRLRGLLTCSVWSDLAGGAQPEPHLCKALAPAVAIEVLHAASLVHDDLPALDNDDMRRGRPSCHKAFGESTAILTGDALFGSALLEVLCDADLSTDSQARLCKLLAQAWWDLCLGQQLDLASKGEASSSGRGGHSHRSMVQLKTGALFGASVASGALCAGVQDALLSEYAMWGVRVGECFQALDDLEDGDRPQEDAAAVMQECELVRRGAEALDVRLAGGVTQAVLALIFGGVPQRLTHAAPAALEA